MPRHEFRPSVDYTIEDRGFETPCWIWQGAKNQDGYGNVYSQGKTRRAHRYAYERRHRPIPLGQELDHQCRQRDCVNPDHLEPVTHRENTLRGTSPRILAYHANTCSNGHPLSGANLIRNSNGSRRCRACHNARRRKPANPQ